MIRNKMPVIIGINASNCGCTGDININILDLTRQHGGKVAIYSPAGRTQKKDIKDNRFIGSIVERRVCDKINYYTGHQGALLYFGTQKLLKELDELRPDIIHLHNMHSNYVNLRMLFKYIKKNNIKVVWTFHDCWPFTGHCPYFDIVECDKWKAQCNHCPMYKEYPASWRDNSEAMYKEKQELFTGVSNMTIVTPSYWLKGLVQESFLKKYPVKVIPNGINLEKFYPRQSDFREKYRLEDKFIVLGCAGSWGKRKGLDRFESLADKLPDDYKIVLVGIDSEKVNGDKILCIKRTTNQDELAKIYAAADVFLNPTREDNFPTVNIEALACGTPILSYGAGGSAEAFDEKSGMIVNDDNVIEVLMQLKDKNFAKEDCIARGKLYDQKIRFLEYVELYDELLKDNN